MYCIYGGHMHTFGKTAFVEMIAVCCYCGGSCCARRERLRIVSRYIQYYSMLHDKQQCARACSVLAGAPACKPLRLCANSANSFFWRVCVGYALPLFFARVRVCFFIEFEGTHDLLFIVLFARTYGMRCW